MGVSDLSDISKLNQFTDHLILICILAGEANFTNNVKLLTKNASAAFCAKTGGKLILPKNETQNLYLRNYLVDNNISDTWLDLEVTVMHWHLDSGMKGS